MIQIKLVIKIMMIGYGYDPVLTDKYSPDIKVDIFVEMLMGCWTVMVPLGMS